MKYVCFKTRIILFMLFGGITCHPAAAADAIETYLFGQDPERYTQLVNPVATKMSLNWLSEPEIRISPEQDARGLNTETYSFRFRPASKRERAAQAKLLDLESTLTALELEDLLAETLSERYLQLITLAEQEALLAIAQQQLQFDEEAIGVEERQSSAANYKLGDLQKVVLAIDRQREYIYRLKNSIKRLRAHTNIAAPALAAGRDTEGFVRLANYFASPREIESLLETEQLQTAQTGIEQRVAQAKLQASKHKRSLEKSRNSFGLDLLELSYENKGIDSYNMTFGFRLPTRSYGSHQARVDYVAAQRIADLTDQIATERKQEATQDIFLELDSYFALRHSLTTVMRRPVPEDSESALIVKRYQLAQAERLVGQHAQVLRSLAKGLQTTGLIYQQPLTNWMASP